MGIGTLRRYHKPVEQEQAPEVEPGPTPTAEEAKAAAEANAAKIQAEQEAQAAAANAHPNAPADTKGDGSAAESVNPIIQEQGGHEEKPGETEPPQVPVAEEPSKTPGDVSVPTEGDLSVAEALHLADEQAKAQQAEERAEAAGAAGLNRGSSTDLWRAFATSRQGGGESLPFDPASTSRDEIAQWYLGTK